MTFLHFAEVTHNWQWHIVQLFIFIYLFITKLQIEILKCKNNVQSH